MIDERMETLKKVEARLRELRGRFFGELKRVGDIVGIPLPEPHEVELLELGRSNLLEQLVALRKQEGREELDIRRALVSLQAKVEAMNLQSVDNSNPLSNSSISLILLAKGKPLNQYSLHDHAIASCDEHTRRQYALFLAAALTTQSAISKSQIRLLYLLLNSLKLGDIRRQLFEQAYGLKPESLLEPIHLILTHKEGLENRLLIDMLVLLRIDTQLNDEMISVISELASAFDLEEAHLEKLAKIASRILGLTKNENDTGPYDYEGKLWHMRLKVWPGEPSFAQKAALQKEINDRMITDFQKSFVRLCVSLFNSNSDRS